MHLEPVDLAEVREEHDVVVRGRHEEVLDEVVVLERHALDALAATLLRAIGRHGEALDVAGVRDGDDHVLLGDEVLDVEVLGDDGGDGGTPLVAEAGRDVAQLVRDDGEDLLGMGEQVLEVLDVAVELGDLVDELLALEAGQALEAHLEDGRALDVVQAKAVVHALLGLGVVTRRADDVDDLVDVVDGDEKALEDVDPLLGLVEVVLGPARDDVDLVVDVVVQDLAEAQRARHSVDEGEVDDAEVGLQLRPLVEVVEHHLRDGTALEVDDDAHALAVGLVAHVRDALDLLLVDRLGDLFLEKTLVDLVRDLGDNEALTPVLDLLDVDLRAHGDGAAAGLVGVLDAVGAHDGAARGEVRAGEHGHELLGGDLGIVDHHADGLGDLVEVVRRDVGRHADGDAVRAVDEEVREPRGQDGRLGERLVVVGLEVDGLLAEVLEHGHGRLGEAGLRVTHGCGGIAVDGAEVAVTIDEREPHREVLGHTDHGVIDGGVAVGVVLAHDLADRPRRLLVRLGGDDARLVHGVEDSAVDRLETVAHVGEGAGHDDRHRVLEEGLLHLGGHVGGLERAAVDVGEVEARACLVGERVVEVGAAEGDSGLLVELVVLRVLLVVAYFLVVDVLVVLGVIDVVDDVVLVVVPVESAVVAVVIVCHCLAFR